MNKDHDKNNVKIAIRWRPAVGNRQVAIEKVDEKIISLSRRQNCVPSTFVLDYIFDSVESTQCEVYDILVRPLVDKALNGYDATFIAIGQTGSGKTYTVGFESSVTSENNGMTARILDSVFSHSKPVDVSISFIEIYNDQAFDLLSKNTQVPFYKKDHRLTLATKKPVNKEDVLVLLSQAVKKRRVRGTNMNSVSSRSHAVLTIFLKINGRESGINLVDLAGSEGFSKTGNIGDAHMEGKCINESLSAFKRVINAMARGENYIPYRDSVITTLLKKSLNTRSYLTLLGCVSPYQDDFGETLSTVHFVCEAKNIKATPQQNAKITEYQKSKTPIKAHLRTPSSTLKTTSTFKKPLFISSARNRIKLQTSRIPMTEPRKNNLSISAHSNTSISANKNLLRNSTSKKSNLFRQSLHRTSMRRSKAVSNLFPTTTSRQMIEDSLQNDELIDWQNASTSSVLVPDQASTNNLTVENPENSKLDQYMNLLMQKLKPIVADKLKNDPNLKMLNFSVMGSEMVDQSLCKPIEGKNRDAMLSPIQSQTLSNELSIAFGNENERNDSQIDFANLTVDVDQANKQILVDVSIASISLTQNLHQNTNQSLNASSCAVITENTFIKTPDNTRLTRNSINTTKSSTKIKSNCYEAIAFDDSSKINENHSVDNFSCINTTPAAEFLSFQHDRTPIGVIRLRKVTPNIETPEIYISDDEEEYEIVVVNKSQHSRMCVDHFDAINSTMDEFRENPPAANYPLMPINSAIASKSTANARPFPFSPRIILHRINSIDEYQQSMSTQEAPNVLDKNKRKPRQIAARTKKDRIQSVPTTSQLAKDVLNILNNGSVKEIRTLWTIGQKTATSIFNYRVNIGGHFNTIDALQDMPFWTNKMHQRFLEKNGIN